MGSLSIYKDWVVTKLVLWCKRKPLYLKTPIDYLFMTFKAAGYLPEKINALEPFGMYGLYLTKHYAKYCDHVDMWEIDPKYVRFARRFKERNVTVIEGDSVSAIRGRSIDNKYNFVMIDNPLISPYGDGLMEHFDILPQVLDLIEPESIIVFNVILIDPNRLYELYNFGSEDQINRKQKWLERRKSFYETKEGLELKPQDYLRLYESKFLQWGFTTSFSTFLPRDQKVGFIGLALKRQNLGSK